MNIRSLAALLLLPYTTYSQSVGQSVLSFSYEDQQVTIPVETAYVHGDQGFVIRAFGITSEQQHNTVLFSLTLQRLSINPAYLNGAQSFIAYSQRDDQAGSFFLSFPFGEGYAFYHARNEVGNRRLETRSVTLFITSIQDVKNGFVITGVFASRHFDDASGKSMKLRNGIFRLLCTAPVDLPVPVLAASQNTELDFPLEHEKFSLSSTPYVLFGSSPVDVSDCFTPYLFYHRSSNHSTDHRQTEEHHSCRAESQDEQARLPETRVERTHTSGEIAHTTRIRERNAEDIRVRDRARDAGIRDTQGRRSNR